MRLIKFSLIGMLVLILSCNARDKKKDIPAQEDAITVAAYYFPNYHTGDPRNENHKGAGWSEWELVKAEKPRFPGDQQPKVPLWGYIDEKDHKVMAKKIERSEERRVGPGCVSKCKYRG